MLNPGDMLPDITLVADDGSEHNLLTCKGEYKIIYFYSKDGTSGCTKEAQSFKEAHSEALNLKAEIVGISSDSVESHAKFKAKHDLPFILLSDTEHTAGEAFGTWAQVTRCGKKSLSALRTTFVSDKSGKIIKVFKKVKSEAHGQLVVDEIKKL